VSDVDPTAFDQRAEASNSETGRDAPENNAGLMRLPFRALVYELRDGDELDLVVLPVEGLGLWSTLYGFLALDADLETIRGLTFYEHGETPGLGGEVDNPRWKSLWPGRKTGVGAEPLIEVIRGRAGPTDEDPFRVDGLSGATMTSRGVTNLLRFWLGDDGFRAYLARLGEEGAA
jgi:Na+-transporting NADH:ubiquinone oxidoreductase subunit C